MAEDKLTLQVPDHIAKRIAARKQSGEHSSILDALTSTVGPPRISIRGVQFRLVQGSVETPVGRNLDVVVVGSNTSVSKVYYAGKWNPEMVTPPDCRSADGKTPDADVAEPECESCANCPNNVLGSAITENGKMTKKCADVRYLAVVPASDPSKVYQLSVSVTAMKGLRAYANELQSFGLLPHEMVTRLGFDDKASYPLVTFERGGWLGDKALAGVERIISSKKEEIDYCTRSGDQPAIAAPAQAEALPAPVETEEVPPPQRKKAAVKKAAPKPKPEPEPEPELEPEPEQAEFSFDDEDEDVQEASSSLEDELAKVLAE
jgi:hypothetical protein